MPSDKMCCVPGCSEARGVSCPVLHLFPHPKQETERFESWRSSVGGHILDLPDEFVYKYRRVCHAHFEKKFHCRNNRLSNIAIPTLNVPVKHIPDVEQSKENKSDGQSTSSYKCQSRKRPLSSTENIIESLPSTSKDEHTIAIDHTKELFSLTKEQSTSSHKIKSRTTLLGSEENVIECIPSTSKDTKTTFKIQSKSLAELKLYRKLIATRAKLRKCENKIKKQAAAINTAKNIMANSSALKALENLPKNAKILTMLQLRETKKKGKGRRFTLEEKIVALSLLKQSPKGYRFLRKIFVLPAPPTLIKLISAANIQPGINKKIFSQMAKKAQHMKPSDKLCVLLFDEMALKANITYNERLDKIIGFVNNGEEITKEFADHAQVFMIRGLVKNYKQPIGYTFSQSATKGPELAKQIKLFIKQISEAGFTVVATVCDQGSGNRNAIKYLIQESRGMWLARGEEPKNNIFLIDSSEIVPLYDPPHLIKCVRNNLLVKNLMYKKEKETRIAKWSHIECLYDKCPAFEGIRLMPKLTENHVKPAKISKMKVKYATQIFSQTVASHMGFLADNDVIPQECKDTAYILLFFDTLFDTMNGSYKKKYRYAKPALQPVTHTSVHKKIWQESKEMLKEMNFIKGDKIEYVPTLSNWIWTLDGIETLINIIGKKYEVNSIWMRHLNQDPLENFFGSVRSHGCRNTNPTPERFESVFATLLINRLSSVHAPGTNCEDDVASTLYALVINEDCRATTEEAATVDLSIVNEINIVDLNDKFKNPQIKAMLHYCSGYFAKKLKNKIFKKCNLCNVTFIDNNESEFIQYREFQKKRWLCSPTMDFIKNVSQMQDVIYKILVKNLEIKCIKEFIKTIILMYVSFDYIKCEQHREKILDYLINLITRFYIYTYCKNINKILGGMRANEDNDDVLQLKAKKHYDKLCKRKK